MSIDSELLELLFRLEDYFDDRADTIDGEVPSPNKEMAFLVEIRKILGDNVFILSKTSFDEWLDEF